MPNFLENLSHGAEVSFGTLRGSQLTLYGIGTIFIIVLKSRFIERRKPEKLQSRFSRENENVTYTLLLLSHRYVFLNNYNNIMVIF